MTITVNNKEFVLRDEDMPKKLMDYLREDLNLTGAKNGCGIGACGACTVIIEKKAVRACVKTVADAAEKEVYTIEGLEGSNGELHPLQQAFVDYAAVQCGYCIPGIILSAHAFLLKNNSPDRESIRKAIKPNLCRCTGYVQIVDAIEAASRHYR